MALFPSARPALRLRVLPRYPVEPSFTQAGAGAVARTLDAKVKDFDPYAEDFGAVGDGAADDTAKIQALLDLATVMTVRLAPKRYRITNKLTIPAGKRLVGAGWSVTSFDVDQASDILGTVLICDFGTATADECIRMSRNSCVEDLCLYWPGQPVPDTGWTPTTTPWAIAAGRFTDTARSVRAERAGGRNLMLLGFSHGIKLERGGEQGRWERIYGQPFTIGMQLDGIHDRITIDQVHFWGFWSVDANVLSYMRNNAIGFDVGRVDGPLFDDVFTWAYGTGIRFRPSSSPDFTGHPTFFVRGGRWYFDSCKTGVLVEGPFSSGAGLSGHVDQVIVQRTSDASVVGDGWGIEIAGQAVGLNFGKVICTGAAFIRPGGHVLVSAVSSVVRIDDITFHEWDSNNAGVPAIQVSDGQAILQVGRITPLNASLGWYIGDKVILRGDDTEYERNLITACFEEIDLNGGAATRTYDLDGTDYKVFQRIWARATAHGAVQYKIIGRTTGHATPATFTIRSELNFGNITHEFTTAGSGANENIDSGWKNIMIENTPRSTPDGGGMVINGTGPATITFTSLALIFR